MSRPGKSDEKFKDKFIAFFKKDHKSESKLAQRHVIRDFSINEEILKDIGPESPLNVRLHTLKALKSDVHCKQLVENAIEAVWKTIKDLFKPHVSTESRHVALDFLISLVEGQLSHLGDLREHFFNVICELKEVEDFDYRLKLLNILTEQGRNLEYFEDTTGKFLLDWMPNVLLTEKKLLFMRFLVKILKYNAAYLDEEVILGLVQQVCRVPSLPMSTDEDIKECLGVLDAVLCYSYLPSEGLKCFIPALCKMVNMPKYCTVSWDLMRKLLGTHLGHSSMHAMCCMLQERQQPANIELLRGAVFFIGVALWGGGNRRVPTLKYTPSSVLPSFLQVLETNNIVVAYEVSLSIRRLVTKYGKDLLHVTWDVILDILEELLKHVEFLKNSKLEVSEPRTSAELHDTLTTMEMLHQNKDYSGSVSRLFKITEMCANNRPVSSVSMLIEYRAQFLHPDKENWLSNLYRLVDKYFRLETRTEIRVKVLAVLSFVLSINKYVHEETLIKEVVLPLLGQINIDPDPAVRKAAIEMFLVLCQSNSAQCFSDLMEIVEKIVTKPLPASLATTDTDVHSSDESHLVDVKSAVIGIVDLFKNKVYKHPPSHCVTLYRILIAHLHAHYQEPDDYKSNTAGAIRHSLIDGLLQLRCDSTYHLGVADKFQDGHVTYSPYMQCKPSSYSEEEPAPSSNPPGGSTNPYPLSQMTAIIDYTETFELFIQCLAHERDWSVMKCVLDYLPLLLQNKTLVLSTAGNLVDVLCNNLCAMVTDPRLGFPDKLVGLPGKFSLSDFHTYIFPVLAAMVTYHNYLDRQRQRDLIRCLEFGLVSKCAKTCVNALRLCTLEMQEVMMRQLPSVLLQLSKISATVSMAIPVLAFLSSIVRFPKMYGNFVEEEYMSVFAIALPYTNPFKFSHYTVSLAHHVIAIWFIQCRLPFRKGFVKFIQKGLKANVLQQFEENAILNLQNQDSRDRARAGSYNESALRDRRRMLSGSQITRTNYQSPVNDKMSQFHHELTETCTDMMARYTFANFAALQQRPKLADFLLAGSQSQTWLLGNKLVTITTSGGSTKMTSSGLCEKCMAYAHKPIGQSEQQNAQPATSSRKRHKSAFNRSVSTLEPMRKHSQDDISVNTRYLDDMGVVSSVSPPLDVGVQTGTSLTGSASSNTAEIDAIDSLMGMNHPSDGRIFHSHMCNCWCTGWAEIFIRAPSGNLSWMMRIENEAALTSSHGSQQADITMIFASMKNKPPDLDSLGSRIDSGSIGEQEYESLYAQHFPSDSNLRAAMNSASQTLAEMTASSSETDTPEDGGKTFSSQELEGMDITGNKGSTHKENHQSTPSPTSMRRSNSSPTLVSSVERNGAKDCSSALWVPSKHTSDWLVDKASIQSTQKYSLKQSLEMEAGKSPASSKLKSTEKISSENSLSDSDYDGSRAFVLGHDKEFDLPFRRYEDSKETVNEEYSSSISSKDGVANVININPTKSISSNYDNFRALSPSPVTSEASSVVEEMIDLTIPRRRRGHTIAVPSELRYRSELLEPQQGRYKENLRGGISPSFVFLQLYHSGMLHSNESPILLPQTEAMTRSLKLFDHIYPYETHKIGVIYVGPGQTKDEKGILSNQYGSDRYAQFVQNLGQLLRLKDCNTNLSYIGGLDVSGNDGQYTYGYQDEATQMVFHIATLMPLKDSDPNCNTKKLHIGNDFVTIVYNDSGEEYKIGTLKGQFNYVNIVIVPLDHKTNAVTLQAKEVPFKESISTDIAEILGHKDTKVISDDNLSVLVRQIAMHCNLASLVLQRQQSMPQDPFASNWLERLRAIKRIHNKVMTEVTPPSDIHTDSRTQLRTHLEDFTDYV